MSDSRGTCRDFERGVCNRGQKCKYYHPEGVQLNNQKLPICKDFQNKGCDRPKCKFLHITSDEEAEYMRTGQLPSHGGHPPEPPRGQPGNDVCKDFLNNICQRGSRCKFRHISENEFQTEQQQMGGGGGGGGGMYGKRRRDDYGGGGMGAGIGAFDEENEMLRRKITDLQRQVLDLRQMNDTLYDQNTRYRNQLRGGQATSADPYAAKSVSYPSAVTQSADAAPRSLYDGYTQF